MSPRGQEPAETTRVAGETPSLADGLDRAAVVLRTARRVLVTGLSDVPADTIQAACDLAELLGAAIDAESIDTARPIGPIVVRAGSMTADPADLRDRADLVVIWFCTPDALAARFMGDLKELLNGIAQSRTILAVGPEPIAMASRQVPLPSSMEVDAARLLHAILLGHAAASDNPTAATVASTCQELRVAIESAACVAIVTCFDENSDGLAPWAVSLLVRAIAHGRPAFMVPLASASTTTPDHSAVAAAVLTWRYGAAGSIAKADRLGGDFRPAECSAIHLIRRAEVDAVLAVGRLSADVEAAIASRAGDLAVVRIESTTPALVALRDRILAGGTP